MTLVVPIGSEKTYNVKELARFFGVSTRSIRHWIIDNRFTDLNNIESFNRIRVSENSYWITYQGQRFQIKNIVKNYEIEEKKRAEFTDEDEHNALLAEINRFEMKYNGSYENTFKDKLNKTSEELRDESEWYYSLNRLHNQF